MKKDLKEKLLQKTFDYDPIEELAQIFKIYGKKVSRDEIRGSVRKVFFVGTREGLYKIAVTKKKVVSKDGTIKWKLVLEKEDPF